VRSDNIAFFMQVELYALCFIAALSYHRCAAFQASYTGLHYYVFASGDGEEIHNKQGGLTTRNFMFCDQRCILGAMFRPEDRAVPALEKNPTIDYSGHVNMGEFSLRCAGALKCCILWQNAFCGRMHQKLCTGSWLACKSELC
jgi:hypothetical protein